MPRDDTDGGLAPAMDEVAEAMAEHVRSLARDRSPETAADVALAVLKGCCRVYCELRGQLTEPSRMEAELLGALRQCVPEGVFSVRH